MITWNGQFYPICSFFQSFPTEAAQNDLKWPILPDSQLFQSFPTKVAQNDLERSILHGKKKKETMIQGNFYERLHFHMDSCAIGPTASLFIITIIIIIIIIIFNILKNNFPHFTIFFPNFSFFDFFMSLVYALQIFNNSDLDLF